MPKHLIAIVKVGKDKKYRIIDIESAKQRIHINNDKIKPVFNYVYKEYSFDECYNSVYNGEIGGLKYRSDRENSFRVKPGIPQIIRTNGNEEIKNTNSIMQCSEKIFVDYKGAKITYDNRVNGYRVVDVRTNHQIFSDSGLKGARIRYNK